MADIIHELDIRAAPSKVHEALTTQEGLSRWWTRAVSAVPKQGAVNEFTFYGGKAVFQLRVDSIEPSRIVWSVVRSPPPQWMGTRIQFEFTPKNDGTNLQFKQGPFASVERFGDFNFTWARFLLSLKQYLETGQGTPDAG